MYAVSADQREEGRQEGAARRIDAAGDKACKFGQLQPHERGAEQKGHRGPKINHGFCAALDGKRAEAAREARDQEA